MINLMRLIIMGELLSTLACIVIGINIQANIPLMFLAFTNVSLLITLEKLLDLETESDEESDM